jgi:hypothetical protein
MIITEPLRRMILQRSQRGLIEVRYFILDSYIQAATRTAENRLTAAIPVL